MANNFFLNQDPLLYGGSMTQIPGEDAFQQRINDAMAQYSMMQQKQNIDTTKGDLLGRLNDMTRSLNPETIAILNGSTEYGRLNSELQGIIQDEILSNIRWKINSNPTAVKNMERQLDIIKEAKQSIEEEQRRSINELNDYVKNYSNMTFDEYKRIKNGQHLETEQPSNNQSSTKQIVL